MGSKSTKSTSTTAANPIATTAYNRLLARSQQLSKQEYQPYTGERVAGFTPDQTRAFEAIRDSQGVWQPYFDEASKYAKQGAQGTAGALEDFNSDNLQKYLNPATQNLVDATMANIRQANATQQNDLLGKAISSGASPFGGDRAGLAAAELARNQDLASNQTIAGLQSDAYNAAVSQFNAQNQARQQALQADRTAAANAGTQFANLGTGAQGANLTDIGSLLTSGGLQQQNAQAGLDTDYDEWKNRVSFPYNNLSWLSGIVGGIAPMLGSTTQGEQSGGGNPLKDIIGGVTSVASMIPFIPSDERVKEGIAAVGRLDNGETVYRYRYKGSPETHIGLLAQEVAEDHPEAVADIGGGILGVNYDKATRRAAGGPAVGFDPTTYSGLGINMPEIRSPGMQAPDLMPKNPDSGGGIDTKALGSFGSALKGAIDSLSSPSGSHLDGGGLGPIYKRGGIVAGYADGGGIDDDLAAYGVDDEPADAPWLAPAEASGIVPSMPPAAAVGAPMALAPAGGIAAANQQQPQTRGGLFGGWSPNLPLLAAGAAILASRSPSAAGAVGEGIIAGLGMHQNQELAKRRQAQLDAKPTILSDGPTTRLLYSDGRMIDTGIPTARWTAAQGQAEARRNKPPETTDIYDPETGQPQKAQWNPEARKWEPIGGVKTLPKRPPSAAVQAAEAGDLEGIQSINAITGELDRFASLIDEGKLDLGGLANLWSGVKNAIGFSDESSRNYASFKATLEKLRNESLRLNKGTQTEGDSERAWNELIANINDPEVVKQRIREINRLNRMAAAFKQTQVQERRELNNLPALDMQKFFGAPGASATSGGEELPTLAPEEARKLPPGTKFRRLDGRIGQVGGGVQ